MSWYKAPWVNIIGTDLAKSVISGNSIVSGRIDCNNTVPFIKVSIKIVVVYGLNSNKGVKVELYGVDSDSSNKADTIPLWSQEIDSYASSERRITIPNIDVSCIDTLQVLVKNLDTNVANVWVSYNAAYFK